MPTPTPITAYRLKETFIFLFRYSLISSTITENLIYYKVLIYIKILSKHKANIIIYRVGQKQGGLQLTMWKIIQ